MRKEKNIFINQKMKINFNIIFTTHTFKYISLEN